MYIKELKSRNMNLPAWLLVLFAIVAGLCFGFSFNIISSLVTNPEKSSCFEATPDIVNTTIQVIFYGVQFTILGVLFPLIGWLTDTIIGRERAINFSLWSCWCGILLQCISYSIQYGTCGLPANIAKYGISGVALLLSMLGIAGLITNIPAYGLDQLRDKPNTHARAFIHWIVWGFFFGVGIVNHPIGTTLRASYYSIIPKNRILHTKSIESHRCLLHFNINSTTLCESP